MAHLASAYTANEYFLGAEGLASGLPPLMIAAEKIASTVAQGTHGRRRVGQGESFWQFRRYQFGDPVHNIDWRQTGKSQRVYIRQNEWEAAQSIWFCFDRSCSMDFRSISELYSKQDCSAVVGLALASLLIRGGEHVALLGAEQAPTGTRAGLKEIAEALSSPSSLERGTAQVHDLPRNAQVVVFSDFLDDFASWERLTKQYVEYGIRGVLVQVIDPAEELLPYDGRVEFRGLEDTQQVLIERVENAREHYQSLWRQHGLKLDALAKQSGWPIIRLRTNSSLSAVLLHLYVQLAEASAV